MKLIIPGELTDLNTYIRAERGNKYAGAGIKHRETDLVALHAISQGLPKLDEHCKVILKFHWYCKNTRKDPDNIVYAKKFILDGLVTAGVLPGDSWKHIVQFTDYWDVDNNNPRIEVIIE